MFHSLKTKWSPGNVIGNHFHGILCDDRRVRHTISTTDYENIGGFFFFTHSVCSQNKFLLGYNSVRSGIYLRNDTTFTCENYTFGVANKFHMAFSSTDAYAFFPCLAEYCFSSAIPCFDSNVVLIFCV